VSASYLLTRVQVDALVFERYPDFQLCIVAASGISNGPSDSQSVHLLRSAEHDARAFFADRPASSDPHVEAWRRAYSAFGSKPSKYLSSTESLLRRVLKDEELPAINQAVDIYNAVSVAHRIPAGGEDADAVRGALRLGIADGSELFEGSDGVGHPDPGEVIWSDDIGVTCRRWNWRQGVRTRLTDKSVSALFVLEALAPVSRDALTAASAELVRSLESAFPLSSCEAAVVSAAR
jgi:DNA/RNA-binding domain of Phe-tRNA-synthetase-like protein